LTNTSIYTTNVLLCYIKSLLESKILGDEIKVMVLNGTLSAF